MPNAKRIDSLVTMYQDFCEESNLSSKYSAEDLLAEGWASANQEKWLKAFILLWEAEHEVNNV